MSDDRMGTVSRAMAVLCAVAEAGEDVAIIDLAAALGLPQSTCHRLLDLLAADGFIERDAKLRRYRIGPAMQRIAALVTARSDVAAQAAPIMTGLTAACGETSVLGRFVPRDLTLLFVHQADAADPLRYRIPLFEPSPVALGASGRAVAAWLDAPDAARAHEAVSSRWPTLAVFEAELEAIRERGYSLSFGEKLEGAVGIAAPVFDARGAVVGSLALTIPEQRYRAERLEELAGQVMDAAAELSRIQGQPKGA